MKKKTLFGKPKHRGQSHRETDRGTREFVAEQLESRVLYSGAPACVAISEVAHEALQQTVDSEFESIDSFVEAAHLPRVPSIETSTPAREMVTWTNFEDLSWEQPATLIPTEVKRWEDSGVIFEPVTAMPAIEHEIVTLPSDYVERSNRYEVEVDRDNEEEGWYFDSTCLDRDEFGVRKGLTFVPGDSQAVESEIAMDRERVEITGLDQIMESVSGVVFSGNLD